MTSETQDNRYFQLIPVGLFLALLCVGLPSGLFDTYRERFLFGTNVQSLLFAVYAFTLVPALLCTPLILKKLTPRGLLLTGVIALIVADLLFVTASGTAMLFIGRAVQGVTVAFLNAAAPQILLALQRRGEGRFNPLALAIATSAGLGLGLFGAKLLADATADADRILFGVHLVLSAAFLGALLRLGTPGTKSSAVPDGDGDSTGAEPTQFLPNRQEDNRRWNSLAGWAGATAWSLGGLFLGLGTVIAAESAPALTAWVPFVFFVAMIAGQLLTRRLQSIVTALILGLGGSAASAVATALAVVVASDSPGAVSATIAVAGSIVGGFSLGVVFVMATSVYERTIDPESEGPQTALFFAKVFGGNSLPTLAVGVIASAAGLDWGLSALAVAVVVSAGVIVTGFRRLATDRRT